MTPTLLRAVIPDVSLPFTRDRHRSVSVVPGGMSSFHVSSVVPPATVLPGEAAAQPEGVIVQPAHGSSMPHPTHQASSSGGTVSKTRTSHQVLFGERFLRKIS